ncbi:poly-beta-1,6 N-acetyl-D-glucosamine synthase [Comamonadaceae bacterium OH2310_COT-174]|uniref:Poly-beta-1,6-N-acetyl-D-glucosamine synthase n=1 Tax=Vandammella animalimorsus TaxID=2029117 RepID=A0A2A2AB14_9BURK|nr:poly-beta-1,6-N-acetyl-D-glucosamine synthase [Vandammella animalimorsus]PAT35730.1 poly-beta-1,6 N-acetyl-D-glucosamine synthase [Vandammella animalimorsus]RRD67417.1 poly-beta-1,6 N-acetyl-D-glucosamine synthase [Comamonadaceae bacterium OH2310_COT-174]
MNRRSLTIPALLAMLLGPLLAAWLFSLEAVLSFVLYYPLFMSCIWVSGGLLFWWRWERHWPWGERMPPPQLPGNPLISIIVPCFNEEQHVRDTIGAALTQRYRHIEVIAVNDGSKDGTARILNEMAALNPKLRVIHLARNQGKAIALQMGALAARSEYLVCIDGDAMLAADSAAYMVAPMLHLAHVGAVTGNPRIRTRSTLIGRIQVGEFSSIIGLIKRTQRIYGRIFTVSGVAAAFRKRALHQAGYWSSNMITEDIDISWKLQMSGWSTFYEPRALCWILMPETIKGLWRQRLRWAQGGAEVFIKNLPVLAQWKHRHMWGLAAEFALSTFWAFCLFYTLLFQIVDWLLPLPASWHHPALAPTAFTGVILALACLIQMLVSLMIERRYERGHGGTLIWTVWYPAAFWLIGFLTSLASYPKVMLRKSQKRARWTSPDRGIAHG